MAFLPGDDVKHSGDEEEGAQAHAVHPGGDPLPAVVRQAMQQSHADDGWHDEELRQGGKKTCLKKKEEMIQVTTFKEIKTNEASHRVSVAVCSMLVAGGLVAAVSGGSSVHEPETRTQEINEKTHTPTLRRQHNHRG